MVANRPVSVEVTPEVADAVNQALVYVLGPRSTYELGASRDAVAEFAMRLAAVAYPLEGHR